MNRLTLMPATTASATAVGAMPPDVVPAASSSRILVVRSSSGTGGSPPRRVGQLRSELMILVLISPGHTALTPTPASTASSSARSDSLMASTACLEAAYGPMAGGALQAASDAVLTTWPSRCATSAGTKLRMPLITPYRFTSSTQRQSSRLVCQVGPKCPATPALLQTT